MTLEEYIKKYGTTSLYILVQRLACRDLRSQLGDEAISMSKHLAQALEDWASRPKCSGEGCYHDHDPGCPLF